MYETKKAPKPNTEQRNEKVRKVLRDALRPMTPSEIALAIRESWCCDGYPSSAAISPVLKRVGAERVSPGRWKLPTDGA